MFLVTTTILRYIIMCLSFICLLSPAIPVIGYCIVQRNPELLNIDTASSNEPTK